MPRVRRLGAIAEDAAAAYVLGLGYVLVTRRFKARSGEIDLVALDGEELVFIEVKTRRESSGAAESAIDTQKIRRLAESAEEYVHATGESNRPSRFDLIAIGPDGLRHTKNAWHP